MVLVVGTCRCGLVMYRAPEAMSFNNTKGAPAVQKHVLITELL